MVNILSRVYNSTLGVPQQLLYRTLRALKEEDVDIFSREGLLAPELLPLLGVFASHESDPTIEDLVGEDTNFAGRLALDIFSDPATYLTAGAFGFAKAAKTVRAGLQGAKKVTKEIADAGIDVTKLKTSGELRGALNEAIEKGVITNRRSKRAAGELAKLDDATEVTKILSESADVSELLISIPGLARWGAVRKAPKSIQGHKSWFGFLNHIAYGKPMNAIGSSQAGKAVARKLGEAARAADMGNDGLVTSALNTIYRIPKAFHVLKASSKDLLPAFGAEIPEFTQSVAEAARFRSKHGAVVDKINLETLSADVDTIRKNLKDRRELLAREKVKYKNNPARLAHIERQEAKILSKAFQGTDIPKELRENFIAQWRGMMGDGVPTATARVPELDFAQMVGRNSELLKKQSQKANELLNKSKVKFKGFKNKKRDELIGKDPHWITKMAYDAGQMKVKFFEFTFGTNKKVNAKFIEMAENNARTADGKIQRTLEAQQHRLLQSLKRVADRTGVPEEEIHKILNITAEGTALPADFAANLSVIRNRASSPEQLKAASGNISDWLNKQRLTLESLGMHTQLDKRAETYLFGIGQKQTDILTDAGRHWSDSEALELLEKTLPEHLKMKFGGRKLVELSDDELRLISGKKDDFNRIADPKMVGKIRRLLKHREYTGGKLIRPDGSAYPLAYKGSKGIVVGEPLSKFSPSEVKEILKRPDLSPELKAEIRKADRNRQKGKPVGKADEILIPQKLGTDIGPELQAYADIRLALDDIKEGRFTERTIMRLERGHRQLGSITRENAMRIFKEADPTDVDALFGLADEASRIAHRANNFSFGAPVGYLPRFKNPDIEKKLREAFGGVDDMVNKHTPNASNLSKRIRDRDITLEDLNTKLEDIEKQFPAAKELLDDIRGTLKKTGNDLGKGRLANDHLDIMFTSMGRDLAQMNAADLVNSTFNHTEAIRHGLIGGKVIDVLDSSKESIKHLHTKESVRSSKHKIQTTLREGETDITPRYVILQKADGKEALVDLADQGVMSDLIGGNLDVLRLGEGDSLGNAFIASNLRAGGRLSVNQVEIGEYMAVGGADVMHGFKTAWTPNAAAFEKGLAAFDRANFFVKRFQTVLRPAHHIANQISGFFQSSAAGASAEAIAEAWVDVSLMMYGPGSSKAKKLFQEAVELPSGLKATSEYNPRTAQYIHALAGNRNADDLIGEGIGHINTPRGIIEHQQVWQNSIDGGLLHGTFAHQELVLGAGSSIRRTQENRIKLGLRYADDKTRAEKLKVAWDKAGDMAQKQEILARMSTVYALVYDGHLLDDAIQLAKKAHVDYSTLGFGERGIMKRAIPYYTFNRKYVPWALGRMAKSPDGAAATVKTVEQSGVLGVSPDGRVSINMGILEADIGRTNANIDALMTLASLADMLPGNFSVEGQQKMRKPGMLAFFQGGVPGILAEGLDLNTDENLSAKNAYGAMMDATFVGRFIERSMQSVEERSATPILRDWTFSYFLPARWQDEPDKSVKFAVASAERSLNRLKGTFKEAKSDAERQRIVAQAQRIRQAVQVTVDDFSK